MTSTNHTGNDELSAETSQLRSTTSPKATTDDAVDLDRETRTASFHPPTPHGTNPTMHFEESNPPNITRQMLESIEPQETFLREETRINRKYPSYVQRMANTEKARTTRSQGAARVAPPGSSFYDLHYGKKDKVIRLDEAINSRPPMPMDLEGPGPTTYTPRNRPLNENNPPSWTMGRRTEPIKEGGSRTAWMKSWMHTTDAWTMKTDFNREPKWPSPSTYRKPDTVGTKQPTMIFGPQHTFGYRRGFQMAKKGAGVEPSPNTYNIDRPSNRLARRHPAFSHGRRRGGTAPWAIKDMTPGPADYHPATAPLHTSFPSFTIRSLRRPATHTLGPFSCF